MVLGLGLERVGRFNQDGSICLMASGSTLIQKDPYHRMLVGVIQTSSGTYYTLIVCWNDR